MRLPAAYGFYPSDPKVLENEVKKLLVQDIEKHEAIGVISPHAGYVYSGSVAGAVFSSIKTNKKRFMLFGPNHTGYGSQIALSNDDWQTPLGVVRNEKGFLKNLPVSEQAHRYEHSLEVQLPFLQVVFGNDIKIIPICLSYMSLQQIENLSKNLVSKDVFYIASSDFTHFGSMYNYQPVNKTDEENLKYVEKTDRKAIDLICKIKPEEFYDFARDKTICGFVPITLLLFIAKQLGAKKGRLIKYSTSYNVHKDSSFVSYAGILLM